MRYSHYYWSNFCNRMHKMAQTDKYFHLFGVDISNNYQAGTIRTIQLWSNICSDFQLERHHMLLHRLWLVNNFHYLRQSRHKFSSRYSYLRGRIASFRSKLENFSRSLQFPVCSTPSNHNPLHLLAAWADGDLQCGEHQATWRYAWRPSHHFQVRQESYFL